MTVWELTPYTLPVFMGSVITGGLAVHVWRRRGALGARWLFVLLLAVSYWSFVYGLEIATIERSIKLSWAQAKYLGIVVTPLAWMAFALIYAGHEKWLTRRRLILLSVLPATAGLLALTNEQHLLMWRNATILTDGPFPALGVTFQWPFWLHTAYSYGLLVAGLTILFRFCRRSRGAMRQQAALMLVGAAIPFVANAVTVLGGNPVSNLDLTPIALVASGITFAWGLMRWRLLDLLPAADVPIVVALDTDVVLALDQTRRRILELLLIGTMVLGFVTVVPALIEAFNQPRVDWVSAVTFSSSYAVIVVVFVARRAPYRYRAAAFSLIWYLFGLVSTLLYGLEIDAGVTIFAFVLFTYILFGEREALAALALSVATVTICAFLLAAGTLTVENRYVAGGDVTHIIVGCFIFLLSVGVTLVATTELERDTETLIQKSRNLSERLEQERETLEERVAERTRALEASFSISRRIGTIVDPEQLIQTVVDDVQAVFGYYHVQVYLVTSDRDRLVVAGGTGPAGAELRQRAHAIAGREGVVGEAAVTRAPTLVDDSRRSGLWQPTPHLPNTRCEAAVPILHGSALLGILNVHADRPRGVDAEAFDALQAVASQLAVALRNADTYQRAQTEAALEAHLNAINRAIRRSSNQETATQVAIREIGKALGDESAAIRFIRRNGTSASAKWPAGAEVEETRHVAQN